MSGSSRSYVPSWCKDADQKKPRTRFKASRDKEVVLKNEYGTSTARADPDFLDYLPNRIVTPAYSTNRPKGEVPFHIPHRLLLPRKSSTEKPISPPPYRSRKTRVDFSLRSSASSGSQKVIPSADIDKIIKDIRVCKEFSFVYLSPHQTAEYTSPYLFQQVPFNEVNPKYYLTLSSSGVVTNDGTRQLFTSLATWERDFHLYQRLSKIRSLQQFRLWKSFTLWRRQISNRKLATARDNLLRGLFILDPILKSCLTEVEGWCIKLETISFPDLSSIENFQLHEFYDFQTQRLSAVLGSLTNFHEVVVELLVRACDLEIQGQESLRVRNKKRIVSHRQELRNELNYLEQFNKKKLCLKLCRLIYRVALTVMGVYREAVRNSYQALSKSLQRHLEFLPSRESLETPTQGMIVVTRRTSAPQVPFFHIRVMADMNGLNLQPSEAEFLKVFSQLLDVWLLQVVRLPDIVTDPELSQFTRPVINGKTIEGLIGDGPSIEFAIETDENIQQIREEITHRLKLNFEFVHIYLLRLIPIHEFYVENLEMNIDQVTQQCEPSILRELLEKYHSQLREIEAVTGQQSLGFLQLHLEDFMRQVLPISKELLQATEKSIPTLGSTKIQVLMNECSKAVEFLENEPKLTSDFMSYLDFIEKLPDRFKAINEQVTYVDEIYSIVAEFEVPCSSEELDAHTHFKTLLASLVDLWNERVEERDDIIGRLSRQIGNDIIGVSKQIQTIHNEIKQDWLISIDSNPEDCMLTLHMLSERLETCQKHSAELRNYQKKYQLEVARFTELDDALSDLKIRILLWETLESWNKAVKEYRYGDFNAIDPENCKKVVTKTLKNIGMVEKNLAVNEITVNLRNELMDFQSRIPVMTHLRNPALKTRHWLRVESLLGRKFAPDEPFNLDTLEACGVLDYVGELEELSAQASSEAALEGLLKKVEAAWQDLELTVINFRDSQDVFILGGLEEVQQVLDDSFIHINTILSSRHVGPIKARVQAWHNSLNLFSNTMDEWTQCQTNWLYLESIFSTPDIQRQLPTEARIFSLVDRTWKEIMRRTKENSLAMQAATIPGTLESLENNNLLIDQILKCLEAYLKSKRVVFPRFYFLSNEELLEILAQTRNPHAVQPHLAKCFDAIKRIEFSDDVRMGTASLDIVAMMSPEGEKVPFVKVVKARGNVEDWLGKVEDVMVKSIRRALKVALSQYEPEERHNWVLQHPAQAVLAASQIIRCSKVHSIFENSVNPLEALKDFETENFDDLKKLAEMVRGDLTPLDRATLCSLITIDVHARDTISQLVSLQVVNSENFEWLKNLRYYWNSTIDDCMVRMSTSCIAYGHEYLGASTRLVVTPLTDKCYLCLMGALQLDLGGAPSGPAGTGKTETTKDLAKALAVQCVVFNCSDSLDFMMMGKFFSGLAQAGAWCCFDEFNRIDIEVLSVIAQQLLTIRNAKVARLARFMFEGREMNLNPRCAAFITMNPGYAGRTELPDNLKALFRPMAMMIPDYALIAEVILYSEGFSSSKILAHKMTQMYKLCSEQLSQQNHYDFGMRALKSVLSMAGQLKRANPDLDENLVLIRALRDSNVPKFLADDIVLFQGILNDMFPGVELAPLDYGVLDKAIRAMLIAEKKQLESCMVRKVIQLYETMAVRHGVMLVGPTGGGKTTVLNTLMKALTHLHENKEKNQNYLPVRKYLMNPKAVSSGELYGEFNAATLEWKDGILGMAVRTATQCEDYMLHWIVCDGPVDAVWIENLNTVLDDNKTLCLANSERIRFTPEMKMVFEVQDLEQASPATVSRCGMIYVDPNELGWLPYVKSWLAYDLSETQVTEGDKVYLLGLFEIHVNECLQFVNKTCPVLISQVNLSKIAALCSLLLAMLKASTFNREVSEPPVRRFLSHYFVFSLLWSIGGNIVELKRSHFEIFVRTSFQALSDVRLPEETDLWGVFVDVRTAEFIPWSTLMPEFKYNSELPFFEILVPTLDTVRSSYLMTQLLSAGRGILFTGHTGVGKSVVAKSVLTTLGASENYVPVPMSFSAQTSSARTQEIIEAHLEKKRKALLGAPVGKKVLLFVDDVNMPAPEVYGSQPPIELIRQYLDFGGFYDREKRFWKDVCDVIVSAACAPPGGGRNPLTPRFVRHFALLAIPPASNEVLTTIFQAIVTGFFSEFTPLVKNLADSIVQCAIAVYRRAETDMLPTPSKSHYVFNLRDLSKCIQGVLQADPGTLRETRPMLRLFYHECLRTFQDRLNSLEDKAYFFQTMKELCVEYFGTPVVEFEESTVVSSPPVLIFGDFVNPGNGEKIYEEAPSMDKLRDILEECLSDYNFTMNQNLKLVLFRDALEHCCRIARILRSERGNGLLVGVGGMGKQCITKLASHLNGYRCVEIELTPNYDLLAFKADLRLMYGTAGIEATPITFLISDNQIVHEEFLEDINNILNSGEVPNLFEGEEYEKIIQGMRVRDVVVGDVTREGIFQAFISRAKQNFHLIITMSPVGDSFRRRCRMFPSLVNSCTIDWFMPWPTEALLSVAKDSLKDTVNEALGTRLYPICVDIHESTEAMSVRLLTEKKRYYYCTPSTYLQLLKVFKDMLTKKSEEVMSLRDRFSNGLQKLYETNAVVDTMKAELVAFEPLLVKKSEATAELMKSLAKEQASADQVRQVVVADEAVAKAKAAETQILADDAQRDLAEAMPAMDSAMKSLDALNKNDIGELKVFNKPPDLVKVVMEAVCLLFGVKQDWASAKLLLGDVNFLKRLRDFDKDHMTEKMLKLLKVKYIENPDFVPDKVATQSKVCRSLCMWVRAIDIYAKVFKVVEPKRKVLAIAEAELSTIMGVLREKQKKLAEVEAQIAGLEAKLDAAVAEKAAVEAAMSLTAARLGRSARLTTALGDEQTRWEDQVQMFTERLQNMVGDILLSAGCVAYFGPFPSDFRAELTAAWLISCERHEVPATASFSVVSSLADAYEVRSWISQGLPQDAVSAENGVLVTRAARWPLMIDPQGQANRWIRGLENEKGLVVIRAGDARSLTILAGAVRTGSSVLIEDVGETLDPIWKPLLSNETFIQSGLTVIKLGDSLVEYDPNFKLYLTTKLQNPHYLPEICILVTLINFTITVKGIEEQLLADVVRLERPDLENSRSELITRINSDKLQLKKIEEKILKMLFSATGNILDDEELIDTLNESKETTEVTAARLEEAEATEKRISAARDRYRPVAKRGAVLQSAVNQLSLVDPMYQYSLTYLSQIFCSVIMITEKIADVDKRVKKLTDEVTLAIFTNVSRGLFERHKLMFAFFVCGSIALDEKTISHNDWIFFLRGSPTAESEPCPYVGMSSKTWLMTSYLSKTFPQFKELSNSLNYLKFSIGDFFQEFSAKFSKSSKKGKTEIDWDVHLNNFEKLMVVKALNEDKLISAITEYVKCDLGPKFVESPAIALRSLFQDTSNVTPLVFVLSPGSDPFSSLQKFAKERGYAEQLSSVSLGQGQGPVAEKMINSAMQKGEWVYLQNCHLALSWMGELERKFLSISEAGDKVHEDFRMFLSSMPFKNFPVAVLQNAVKVTNEPPRGLRANIHRSLTDLSKTFFEDSALRDSWRRMVFGLCFFHAYIQERKNFGPLGWNIPYEFNDSDREVALTNLKMFCSDVVIPWDALQYITCEVTYGGRVTDLWDLRCLKTALNKFFSPSTLEPGYKFSSSGIYYCPESPDCSSLVAYKKFVDKFPLSESAEVFGLSENANSTYKKRVANDMILSILEMEPKETRVAGISNDNIVLELADMVLTKLTESITQDGAASIIIQKDAQGRSAPLSTVLLQEVARFNKLLQIVKGSLRDLKKGVKGIIVLTQELESVYDAFIKNQVPLIWSRAAYPSMKSLASWVQDLQLRIHFIQSWLNEGSPSSFWLPGLTFPQGFLTAVLQTHARKLGIPIDELHFDFIVGNEAIFQKEGFDLNEVQKPSDGVLVHGLYLEAARWDAEMQQLVDPNIGDSLAPLPVLWLLPTTEKLATYRRYECPLYKTAERAGVLSTTGASTNFVMTVLLNTDRDPSEWILKGTALLTQISD